MGQTTSARRPRAIRLALAAVILVALQTAAAAPAGAVTDAPVLGGTGGSVDAHAGPATAEPVVARIPSGTTVSIQCTVHQGEHVAGTLASGEIWDRLPDGSYVADAFADTGTPDPVEPDCADAGAYPYTDESWDAVDPWNFYFRECTSYAAHRLNQAGIGFSNSYGGVHWGDASNWDDAARTLAVMPGYEYVTVDATPSVGDVAQSDAGGFGHVAYVAAVHADGTVTVEEYNYDVDDGSSDHNFNERTVPTSSFEYIDLNG